MTARLIGQISGLPNQLLSESRLETTQQGFSLTPNYEPIEANTFSLKLFMGGNLVHEQSGVTGSVELISGASDKVECCNHSPHGWSYTGFTAEYQIASAALMVDGVILEAENPRKQVDFVSAIEERASGIPQFTIVDSFLMAFGLPGEVGQSHHSLGQATFQASQERVVVSNIGSSGNDGVNIGLVGIVVPRQTLALDVVVEPVDLGVKDAMIQIEATGTLGGVAATSLGSAELRNAGDSIEVFVSSETPDATDSEIAVFNNGILHGVIRARTNAIVGVVTGVAPSIVGFGIASEFPEFPNSFVLRWDGVASFVSQDGTMLEGDMFLLLPDAFRDSQEVLNGLASFSIRAANTSSLVIIAESANAEIQELR